MNKCILLITLLICNDCFSQSQDLKQLELDIQKLAQLKSMLSEMSRGYSILDKGYGAVKVLSKTNYDLHKTYLDKLMDVSATVKNDPKFASTFDLQKQISEACRSSLSMLTQSTVFTTQEKSQIASFLQNSITRSNSLIDELKMVATPGVLRMNDAERLQAIARIENAMKEKLSSVLQQKKNIESLNTLRTKQISETQKLKSLF